MKAKHTRPPYTFQCGDGNRQPQLGVPMPFQWPSWPLSTILPIHEQQWATPQLQNQQVGATVSQTQPRLVPSPYFPTPTCCNVTQSMARTTANLLGDDVQNYEASATWYRWPSLSIHLFGGDKLWKRLTLCPSPKSTWSTLLQQTLDHGQIATVWANHVHEQHV